MKLILTPEKLVIIFNTIKKMKVLLSIKFNLTVYSLIELTKLFVKII